MITAKNYAAQAERDLMIFARRGTIDRDSLVKSATDIKNAVHFVLPDTGRIFFDDYKGIIGEYVIPPFPLMTVEFFAPSPHAKILILIKQIGDEVYFTGFWSANRSAFYPVTAQVGCWRIDTPFMGLDKAGNTPNLFLTYSPYAYCPSLESLMHEKIELMVASFRPVLELCEALTCRNVSTSNHQEGSLVNVKLIRDGKLPFYETKMLVVDTNYAESGKIGNGGGSHASPRQHLRRGHIRRLEKGNIWVNSCVVGDPSKGRIDKQYQVI